jgi:hypothetical protein
VRCFGGTYRFSFQGRIVNQRINLHGDLCFILPHIGLLLALLFGSEDGSDMFARRVAPFPNYKTHNTTPLNPSQPLLWDHCETLIFRLSGWGWEVKEEWTKQEEGTEIAPFVIWYISVASVQSVLTTSILVCLSSYYIASTNAIIQWVTTDSSCLPLPKTLTIGVPSCRQTVVAAHSTDHAK